MNKFDAICLELMNELSRSKNFDDWNLASVGLDKSRYLSGPVSKPAKSEPDPKLIQCPHCGEQFYNENGSHDA